MPIEVALDDPGNVALVGDRLPRSGAPAISGLPAPGAAPAAGLAAPAVTVRARTAPGRDAPTSRMDAVAVPRSCGVAGGDCGFPARRRFAHRAVCTVALAGPPGRSGRFASRFQGSPRPWRRVVVRRCDDGRLLSPAVGRGGRSARGGAVRWVRAVGGLSAGCSSSAGAARWSAGSSGWRTRESSDVEDRAQLVLAPSSPATISSMAGWRSASRTMGRPPALGHADRRPFPGGGRAADRPRRSRRSRRVWSRSERHRRAGTTAACSSDRARRHRRVRQAG